jgi:D-tyrosyl-tRNA(Tyr) deacylase
MIALLQRVRSAWVEIDGERIAEIAVGLLVLVGVRPDDGLENAEKLLERVLSYRVFPDRQGRMNLSIRQCQGALLLVPQFTLTADTGKGLRPGFSTAASPDHAQRLFAAMTSMAQNRHQPVACGRFGAEMQVGLVNDGPVTFWLER